MPEVRIPFSSRGFNYLSHHAPSRNIHRFALRETITAAAVIHHRALQLLYSFFRKNTTGNFMKFRFEAHLKASIIHRDRFR